MDLIGRLINLPDMNGITVVPVKTSGGGYMCLEIGDSSGIECYIRGDVFENYIDLTKFFS